MKITATRLYFLNEQDVQRFDAENRDPDAYFQGVLPQTTAHFISQRDLQADEHAWLAEMGYDHEEGFEVLFSTRDGDELRATLLSELLERDYAVCAWSDRLLFQPGALRIQHMVEMDLLHAVLKLPDGFAVRSVQTALDGIGNTRHMSSGDATNAEKGSQQTSETLLFRLRPGSFYALDKLQAKAFDAAHSQNKQRFVGMRPGGNAYLLDYHDFDPLIDEDFDLGDPETGCFVEFGPAMSEEQQLALCSGLIDLGYAVSFYPTRLLLVPWHRDAVTEVAGRDIEQILSDFQRRKHRGVQAHP